MKQLEILYRRQVTFLKTVSVSDKLAERLLKLDEGDDLLQGQASWGNEEEDTEEVEKHVYKADEVASDDFTLIAEDLTSIADIYDMNNEIVDISIKIPKEKKKQAE